MPKKKKRVRTFRSQALAEFRANQVAVDTAFVQAMRNADNGIEMTGLGLMQMVLNIARGASLQNAFEAAASDLIMNTNTVVCANPECGVYITQGMKGKMYTTCPECSQSLAKAYRPTREDVRKLFVERRKDEMQ